MISLVLQKKLKSRDERRVKEKVEGKQVAKSSTKLRNTKSKNEIGQTFSFIVPLAIITSTLAIVQPLILSKGVSIQAYILVPPQAPIFNEKDLSNQATFS